MNKRITLSNVMNATIRDWQNYLNDIYHEKNRKLSSKFIWLKVIEHSTRLSEGIRKRDFFEAISSVARVFCWTCSFVTNNQELLENNDLEDMLWYKYPRSCSYCAYPLTGGVKDFIMKRKGLPCICDPKIDLRSQKRAEAPHLAKYRQTFEKPETLQDWTEMFSSIFHQHLMSLDSVCFHLLEEVGEVLSTIRFYSDFTLNCPKGKHSVEEVKKINEKFVLLEQVCKKADARYEDFVHVIKQAIKEEIADVISWLFSLTTKLVSLRESFSDYEKLASVLIGKFPESKALSVLAGGKVTRAVKMLNLPSILYIWYGNGCTICNNFLRGSDVCLCEREVSHRFIENEGNGAHKNLGCAHC